MPNIKQQKKRVRTAAEERLENLRYRSTIKTLAKRLATVADEGDAAAIAEEHKNLVRWVDRAVTRGALHRNAAARKKSQAARLVSSVASGAAAAVVVAPPATPAAKKLRASRAAKA
jgi:small subunit ribosomal protein S20